MKTDNDKPIDLAEHSIARQAGQLNKELQPETDLWPAIAEKISELPQEESGSSKRHRWMPMAMAASLLLAVGAIGFSGYSHYSLQQQIDSQIVEASASTLIEQPYSMVRTGYMEMMARDDSQMTPEVREVLKKNLKIIDDATEEIRKALKANPNDPFLLDALLLIREQELQLFNQVTNQEPNTI